MTLISHLLSPLLFACLLWDRVSVCIPGWLSPHYVHQDGLKSCRPMSLCSEASVPMHTYFYPNSLPTDKFSFPATLPLCGTVVECLEAPFYCRTTVWCGLSCLIHIWAIPFGSVVSNSLQSWLFGPHASASIDLLAWCVLWSLLFGLRTVSQFSVSATVLRGVSAALFLLYHLLKALVIVVGRRQYLLVFAISFFFFPGSVCLILWSLIHLELSLVQGDNSGSIWNLVYAAIQFDQHHC